MLLDLNIYKLMRIIIRYIIKKDKGYGRIVCSWKIIIV